MLVLFSWSLLERFHSGVSLGDALFEAARNQLVKLICAFTKISRTFETSNVTQILFDYRVFTNSISVYN